MDQLRIDRPIRSHPSYCRWHKNNPIPTPPSLGPRPEVKIFNENGGEEPAAKGTGQVHRVKADRY